jgi:plasmid stability protein
MKTTLDLPDDLYRKVKTRAARENRKVRELVTDGLRMLLASPGPSAGDESSPANVQAESEQARSLRALDAILASPPSPPGHTERLLAEAERLRREGWSSGDAPS